LQGLHALAAQGLHGLQGLHALAAHGLHGLQGLHALAAQGLHGLQGLQALAEQGLHGLQGLQAAKAGLLSTALTAIVAGTATASPRISGRVAVVESRMFLRLFINTTSNSG
jgi:hypothetical protein